MCTKGFYKIFFISWIVMLMAFSLSYGQLKLEPKAQPKAPTTHEVPSTKVTIPDAPVIREFTGPTYPVVQGTEITLRWRVEPGPGGSPVTSVNIVASYLPEPEVPLHPIGERRFLFLGGDFTEDRTYRLTATNSAGRSASRTLVVRHILIRDALDQLTISLRAIPPEFKTGQPIDLEIGLSNREGPPLFGLNISVTQGGRVAGSLTDIRLGHGTILALQRLRDTGFTGTPGEYIVDVEYRDVHRLKRFRTVSVPYFALVPAP